MGLDETAKQVKQKAMRIIDRAMQIEQLCDLVLAKHQVGGDTFELSDANKQKAINHYQPLKAQLKALVDELP